MCVYVHVHMCMCVRACVCMYVHVCASMYLHVCACTHVHVCASMYLHVCASMCVSLSDARIDKNRQGLHTSVKPTVLSQHWDSISQMPDPPHTLDIHILRISGRPFMHKDRGREREKETELILTSILEWQQTHTCTHTHTREADWLTWDSKTGGREIGGFPIESPD